MRFGIQHSGFKIQKEKYENGFQNKYRILENQSMCPLYSPIIRLLFHTKIRTLQSRGFSRKFPSVACCTFGILDIRSLTPNRFKISLVTHWIYLATIATISKSLLNTKHKSCSFKLKFPKHFYEDCYFG